MSLRARARRNPAWIAAAVAGLVLLVLSGIAAAGIGKAQRDQKATLAIAWGAYALILVAYPLLAERRRWKLLPLGLLAWWVAFELCASRFLLHRLSLWHYGIMQDVDHRPKAVGGEFNSDPLRWTAESSEFTPAELNIVFLGDSFTFGSGLQVDVAFPRVTAVRLGEAFPGTRMRAANFGWVSSSPLLAYRRLRDIGEKYHPALVVMCVDMTDFKDDIMYGHMLERRGLYAWYDRLPITLKCFRLRAPETYARLVSWSVGGAPTQRFFMSEAPLEETRRYLEPLAANVQRIADWCRARGVDFVLAVLPRCYQYDEREAPQSWERGEYTTLGPYSLEPFRFFDELREQVDYPIVSLLEDFRETDVFPTCFPDDPHWNGAGHRVAGTALARELAPILARRLER